MMDSLNARTDMPHGVEFVAFASAYPLQQVTNDEFLSRVRFSPEDGWARISEEGGIRTRRWCANDEGTASLMERAIARLTSEHPLAMAEVSAVVVASGTTALAVLPASPLEPAKADLAPLALGQVGGSHALAIDIKACYCTGFLRGLEIADGLLANPNRRAVLVIAVEQGSKLATERSNRSSFCFLIGDAAGAALLRRAPRRPQRGLLDYCGYTDQRKLDWVGIGADAKSIIMKGSKAAEASAELFIECGRTLLERNRMTPRDVDWLLPLQTHRQLVGRVATELGWEEQRILWDAAELGFSGSASIPACLSDKIEQRVVQPGQRVLALAVGAGLNCAAALFTC